MAENLAKKTIRGAGWGFLDNVANQGITFLVGIFLARLLSPEEYGLIGIITIFIVLFTAIVDSGLSTALIRDKDSDQKDYNTAFWVNAFLGVVMYGILYLASPAIGHFFERDELVPLTRVLGVVLIINAVSVVQKTIMTKLLDFKTQTKVSIIASTASGVIGIGMALEGAGVWSLVAQQLSRQGLQSLLLWFWSKWHPRCEFVWNSFHKMFGFGWKIMISGIINALWNEAYQVVIGKFYMPSTLGQYTRAKQFSDIFSSNLTSVVQRVTFPSLSEIQDEELRLRTAYRRVLKLTMLISLVLLFGLAAIADNLIYVLIGPQWKEAANYLPIICLQCITYPVNSTNLNILMVKGRSDIYLGLEIAKKALAIVPLVLGIFFNIYWMLWSSVVYGFIAFAMNSYFSGKQIKYATFAQLRDMAPAFLLSMVMAVLVYGLGKIGLSPYVALPLQIITGAAVIIAWLYIGKNEEYIYIYDLLKKMIKKQ